MNKIAQRLNWYNKLQEMSDLSGKRMEKKFTESFKVVMDNLRKADDNIRSIVVGESLGDGDPGADKTSLKDLLKQSKSNINRREYMTAISLLTRFNKKLREINTVISTLKQETDDIVHGEFLYKGLSDEDRKHLEDLKTHWETTASLEDELIKQAGLGDFLYGMFNERGRALAAWEKRYPKKMKQLKEGLLTLQAEAEKTNAAILGSLKLMAAARSTRNPDKYFEAAMPKSGGIKASVANFDVQFKKLYDGQISPLIKDIKLNAPTVSVDKKETKEMGDQTIPTKENVKIKTDFGPDIETNVPVSPGGGPSHLSMPPMPTETPGVPDTEKTVSMTPTERSISMTPTEKVGPPSGMVDPYSRTEYAPRSSTINPVSPTLPPTPEELEELGGGRAAEVARQIQQTNPLSTHPTIPSAHASFFSSLQKMGNESPLVLASLISKYARKIQSNDPLTSIQLLKIVKQIRG